MKTRSVQSIVSSSCLQACLPNLNYLRIFSAKELNSSLLRNFLAFDNDFSSFSDCSVREYWDEEIKLLIDRDINAGVNVKRVGLGLFPTIKRRKGNPVVKASTSTTNSTLKEVLLVHQFWTTWKPALY